MANIVEKAALEIADEIAAAQGCAVVDAEYKKENGGRYLRIYIDKEGGTGIDDCEKFSRAFDEVFDKKNIIEEAYSLEVSSPGVDRILKKEREFRHYIGAHVRVKLYKAAENGEKELDGILSDYSDKTAFIDCGGKIISINTADAAYIRLYFEF